MQYPRTSDQSQFGIGLLTDVTPIRSADRPPPTWTTTVLSTSTTKQTVIKGQSQSDPTEDEEVDSAGD